MLKTVSVRTTIAAMLAGLSISAHAMADSPKSVDIPAGELRQALLKVSEQFGTDLVYSPEQIQGIKTHGAHGELTTEQAITKLLEGTKLLLRTDPSGAMLIAPPAAPKSVPLSDAGQENAADGEKKSFLSRFRLAQSDSSQIRLAQTEQSASDSAQSRRSAPEEPPTPKGIPEILVQGSKILNMDLKRSADDPQPYVIFDRETIARSGATNVESFLKERLTMSDSTQSSGESGGIGNMGRGNSVINLRGLGPGQTLILIDGRRVSPPQIQGSQLQPDLNGIPMAAIERIEVLPTTASGIYGGSATGGVINIVLRRDYAGVETKLTYDNSFAADAASGRIDFSAGYNFEEGKTNVLFSGSLTRSSLMEAQERDFYQRGLDRVLANNPALILGSSSPPVGSTPNIRSSNGSNLTLKNGTSLNSPITFVPVGYAGPSSDNGAGLAANAGRYNLDFADSGQLGGGGQSDILGASRAKSLMATVRRQFTPWLQAYLDGAWSENPERHYNAPSGSFSIAAGSPNNPFNQAVIVRVPTTELSGDTGFMNRNKRLAAGAILKLPKDWLAAGDVTWNSTSLRNHVAPTIMASAVSAITNGAAGTPNLFHDPAVAPFNLQALPLVDSFPVPFDSTFRAESVRVSGPTLTLPGGPITFSALLEHRREDLASGYTVSSTGVSNLFPHRSQSVVSGYAELFLPLVSQLNRRPLLEELGVQLAGRHDDYTINGTNSAVSPTGTVVGATARTSSTNPTVAVRYEPVRGIAFRASYGTGFVAPNVTQLVRNAAPLLSIQTDPRRGNQSVTVPVLFGGNPDLRPENSRSTSAGIILTPSIVPELRLSVDYTRIEKTDNISTLTSQQIIDNEALFPDRVKRAAPAAGDPFGVGVITEADSTAVNASGARYEAYDVALSYNRTLGEIGSIDLFAASTFTKRLATQFVAGQPWVNLLGIEGNSAASFINPGTPLKSKANAGVTWKRSGWTLGWRTNFYDSYYVADPAAASSVPTLMAQGNGGRVDGQVYHDALAVYAFERLAHDGPWGWLGRTEVQLTVRNVFHKTPPYDAGVQIPGYYSAFGDPRISSYSISLKTDF